jgi:chromate transporter
MSTGNASLSAVALHFLGLSMIAVGGANAVVPEMQRHAVEVAGWMTDRQFADLFAIAQVAPGPNIIVVTLIGYQIAGLAGALTATVAMCGPTCLLAYGFGLTWERYKHARWRLIIQDALVPVSVGLIAASALILARSADNTWQALAVTLAAAAFSYFTRYNPLWMFAVAALLGYAGLV